MPLNPNEAMVVFARKAETIAEISDGVRMGVQLVQAFSARCNQLEQYIQANGLQVPPPVGEGRPANVTDIRPPTA